MRTIQKTALAKKKYRVESNCCNLFIHLHKLQHLKFNLEMLTKTNTCTYKKTASSKISTENSFCMEHKKSGLLKGSEVGNLPNYKN